MSASTITTVAGTGTLGSSGDGGPATSAQLANPDGLAFDAQGALYISDNRGNRVRKVSAGTITTVAGTGVAGFLGDGGGPATEAKLDGPTGLAVAADGTLYFADFRNNRVRRVTGGGIGTIAGIGEAGYSGDDGPSTSARLHSPAGVAVDREGNLYIADYGNNRIRKVTRGRITTFAGTGVAGFSGDGGPAAAAELNHPYGVAVDGGGNVYIADQNNHRVREVGSDGVIRTIAGTGDAGFSGDGGPATKAQLNLPTAVAVDTRGNVYVTDHDNQRVRRVSSGTITTIAGTGTAGFSGDGGPASAAQLAGPDAVAVDADGDLYIADTDNNRVRKVANLPPRPTFTATPTSGRAPLTVSFDTAGSSDPDGILVETPAWRFGDGTTGTGETTRHTYTRAGTFTVTVTMRDDTGAEASATRTITVTAPATSPPPPPTPPPSSPLKLTLGGPTLQRPLARKAVTVVAACDRPCSLTATGRVRMGRRALGLVGASRTLGAAGTTTLSLRVLPAARTKLGLLLKPGRRARASITVRATGAGGGSVTATRVVAVRR
jgi:PKD repeat protein